jgi:hypothetical protein
VQHGVDVIEGWAAVACVAGVGGGLLLTAGVLSLRSRSLRDDRSVPATYRTEGEEGSSRGRNTRELALVMVVLGVLSQLLYVGLYVELAGWLLGAKEPPSVVIALFFWVLLAAATSAGAALYTGWGGDAG